jgi:hypothetical protein
VTKVRSDSCGPVTVTRSDGDTLPSHGKSTCEAATLLTGSTENTHM